ncbi:hypothetical protein ACP8HI_08385 [Paenibacillus sp. FA6]|uniref:hypothetical protein n=1 Tax=Paenibacillus sp. FA6 TaxID=3413029 RepID=UPI003F656515
MEQEVDLLRPIFVLLNHNKECFDEKWRLVQSGSENINIQTEVINPIFSYITDKLNKLSDYLVKANINKRTEKQLDFFIDYLNTLKRYKKEDLDPKFTFQYMFMYNELLLRSERYTILVEEINKIRK